MGRRQTVKCGHFIRQFSQYLTVADPGFPRGGGANSPGGAPTYDFAKFPQKPHEIERIWTPRGDARPKFYYVDPPLLMPLSTKNNSML